MHPESNPHPDEDLSALVDGEVDASLAAALSGQWRDDAALRSRWHAYQLIGDVLRWPAVTSQHVEHARDILIWLPPGYREDHRRRYPVAAGRRHQRGSGSLPR